MRNVSQAINSVAQHKKKVFRAAASLRSSTNGSSLNETCLSYFRGVFLSPPPPPSPSCVCLCSRTYNGRAQYLGVTRSVSALLPWFGLAELASCLLVKVVALSWTLGRADDEDAGSRRSAAVVVGRWRLASSPSRRMIVALMVVPIRSCVSTRWRASCGPTMRVVAQSWWVDFV